MDFPDHPFKNYTVSPRGPVIPSQICFSPYLSLPSNIKYFFVCLLYVFYKNVSYMKAKIFVCLINCCVSSFGVQQPLIYLFNKQMNLVICQSRDNSVIFNFSILQVVLHWLSFYVSCMNMNFQVVRCVHIQSYQTAKLFSTVAEP